MRRNRASAKKAGAKFERDIADTLAKHIDDRIDRRVKTGAKDCGDIANLRTAWNDKITVECKNTTRLNIGGWLKEVERERINDDAYIGVVMFKRHGIADPLEQCVMMTVRNFIKLNDGKIDGDAL